ncbi:hypothetical protein GGI43DRAFT_352751 [Trichoderma evansii]
MMRRVEPLFCFSLSIALIIAFVMPTCRHFTKKIFGHTHQLHPGTLAHRNQVPGFEFFFASQSDLRDMAQKAVVSIRH